MTNSLFNPNTHYAIHHLPPPADTEHVKRRCLDVRYANLSESQKLDIYLPDEGSGPFPVIVAIHGGAFMGCDKADAQVLPMLEALKRDYAVVSINYRLSWEALFPALIHDAKAAVRWIRANAHEFQFDPTRVAVWGGSAGGYQSLMLGITEGLPEFEDLSLGNEQQPSNVQAVIDWFGPTDFLKMDEQLAASDMAPPEAFAHNGANSPESLLLGQKITEIPEKVKAANPENYIRPGLPPFYIQHGNKDNTVPYQQSVNIAQKLKSVLGEDHVKFEILPNARHGDSLFETPENVKKVLDFLDAVLNREV